MLLKTVFQYAALPCAVALATGPASAPAEPSIKALYEITLDIDNDGKTDRAVLVLVGGPERTNFGPLSDERYGLGAGESVDLYLYLAVGDEKLDLSRKPAFLRKDIVDPEETPWVQPLESSGKGSLIVTSVYGWGARQSWGQAITIIHRGGELLVAGYSRDWEWGNEVHKSDGSWDVETTIGGCDINFLTGKGVVSEGLEEGKPIEGKFTLLKLADWSDDKRPEECDF